MGNGIKVIINKTTNQDPGPLVKPKDFDSTIRGRAIRGRCDPQSVGLPNVAVRSRVIINGRISGSDHTRQDQESDRHR